MGWDARMLRIFLATALLACCGLEATAAAADLTVKAKPKAPATTSYWVEADYLYWTVKGDKLPALVSTGILGAPGTVVLFGDSTVNDRWHSGGRVRAGAWFDPQRSWGVEASFFGLQDASADFNASSNGSTVLARPFFNVLIGAQDEFLLASPRGFGGQIAIGETSRLWGAGLVLRKEVCADCAGRISALVGYRFLRASDDLSISTNEQGNVPGIGVFAEAVTDQFGTANNFSGLDLGLTGETRLGAWTFEWLGKLAVGANYSTAQVNGTTILSGGGGPPMIFAAGVLAAPSNSGNFNATRFAVAPELAVKAGYQVTPQLRLHAGYDFLFWSNVVRPGGVIDTAINPNQLPPSPPVAPNRPAPRLDGADFWAHGIEVGADFSF